MSEELYAAWRKKEEASFQKIRETKPELLERPQTPDPDFILGMIGVTYLPKTRTRGYIRLYPQDFLVEEIAEDGTQVELASARPFRDNADQRTLYADLVKAGIAHLHAVHDLESIFTMGPGRLGYAGIKDAFAVTAQRVSLRGITKEQAEKFAHPNIVLRPVGYGSGVLQPGSLAGNRFTITVRTENGTFDEGVIDTLGSIGGYNFYGPQRFGFRMVSHLLGQKLLRGDVDGAIRLYLTRPGPFDVPLYREIRESFDAMYGDWPKMLALAQHLPHSLRDEIRVLESLAREPKKTRAALAAIKDQVKFWVQAYSSWVINRHLSRLVEGGGPLPDALALPLSPGGIPEGYVDLIEGDGTEDFEQALAPFSFLQLHTKTIPTRLQAKQVAYEPIPQGVVMRFTLGKGSYATSFLSHAFRLYEGMPIPDWVQDGDVDGLSVMGSGSLGIWKERFKDILVRRDTRKEKEEEE